MTGYLIIRSDPYMTISAADGTFEIKNIPVGEHEFQLWHEQAGYVKEVTAGGATANSRGRITLNVTADGVDLGDIKVPASLFSD